MKWISFVTVILLFSATTAAQQEVLTEEQRAYQNALSAAQRGDAAAQCDVGYRYEIGLGVTKDFGKAAEWYRKSAEHGFAIAQDNLGLCYENGRGVECDLNNAFGWYRKSALQGNGHAQNHLGYCFQYGRGVQQDFKQAIEWYRKSAKQGNAYAQLNLGVCYANGNGVEKNFAEAVTWFRKASEQGNADAQGNLALFLYRGLGVAEDNSQAFVWFKKAAQQGHAESQHWLGHMYHHGQGVTADVRESIKWHRMAISQDDKWASKLLHLYNDNEEARHLINKEEAMELVFKSAEGDEFEIGRIYAHQDYGYGQLAELVDCSKWIELSPSTAIEWFQKGAANGIARAQRALAITYEQGFGVEKNLKLAEKWRREAAKAGDFRSQVELAKAYELGEGVRRDIDEAVHWHKQAVRNNRGDFHETSSIVESYAALVRIFRDQQIESLDESVLGELFVLLKANRTGSEDGSYRPWRASLLCQRLYEYGFSRQSYELAEELQIFAVSKTNDDYIHEEALKSCLELASKMHGYSVSNLLPHVEKHLEVVEKAVSSGKRQSLPIDLVTQLAWYYRTHGDVNKGETLLRHWISIADDSSEERYVKTHFEESLLEFLKLSGESFDEIRAAEERFRAMPVDLPEYFQPENARNRLVYEITCCQELALAYVTAERPSDALALFERALRKAGINLADSNAAHKVHNDDDKPWWSALQVAGLLSKVGRSEEAKTWYEAFLEKIGSEGSPDALNGLAIALDQLRREQEAFDRFAESGLFVEPRMQLLIHPGAIRYAKLLQKRGNSAEAEKIIRERISQHDTILKLLQVHSGSTSILEEVRFSYEHLVSPEGFLTDFYEADNQLKKASSHQNEQLRESVEYAQKRLAFLPEGRRVRYLADHFQPRLAKALALGVYMSKDESVRELSAGWLLNAKSIAHEVLAESVLDTMDQSPEKVAELKLVRSQLAAASLMSDEHAEKAQLVAKYEKEQETLESELTYQRMQRRGGSPWIEIETARSAIPNSAVFVNLARVAPYDFEKSFDSVKETWLASHYYAWIVPPAGSKAIECIDLGDAERIDTLVGRIRDQLNEFPTTFQKAGEQAAEQELRRDLQELTRIVYGPLASHLQETSELIISPDGELWSIPWETFFNNGEYLIEKKRIRYLISGRELVQQNGTSSELSPPVIYAAADYNLDADQLAALTINEHTSLAMRSHQQMHFPPLPYSRAEATSIAPAIETFTRKLPLQHVGADATESSFKQLRQPQVLVISTHGYFQTDKKITNPLLRCGLAFAGANNRRNAASMGKEDGILTGLEIVGTNLRDTQLVVLSACESGLGELRDGEGVVGLRQAFQLAGAESVVSSLWKIEDGESAKLISEFFDNLSKGMSKSQALRAAQLSRIDSRRQRHGAAHPFFWAAFTLTGQD